MYKTITTALCSFVLLGIMSCQKERKSQETKKVDNTISVEVAIDAAQRFISKQTVLKTLKKGTLEPVFTNYNYRLDSIIYSDTAKNTPLIYILKEIDGHGFVITSANSAAPPILAYSTANVTQKASAVPMASWIMAQKHQLEQTRISSKLKSGNAEGILWTDLLPKVEEAATDIQISCKMLGPLLETQWGQGDGYNDSLERREDCDLFENKRMPTGCVITAMTQVMYYWKSPSCFNWQIMPHSNRDEVSASAWQETAHVMKLIGTLCNAKYSCAGTGANTYDGEWVLTAAGYSYKSAFIESQEKISEHIIQSLEALKPVIMSGDEYSYQTAHAWVCDGYSTNTVRTISTQTRTLQQESDANTTFFHMNWGWDGRYDGWFLYNNLTASIYSFNCREILYDISPQRDETLKYPKNNNVPF